MRNDIQAALKQVVTGDEPGKIEAEFRFDDKHEFFAGHFPGRPLLPGIFHIGMVREAVAAATGVQYDIVRVAKAKFTDEVRPGETVRLQATLTEEEPPRVRATLFNSRGPAAKVSLVLRVRGPRPLPADSA